MTSYNIRELTAQYPLIKELIELKETSWFNPSVTTLDEALPYVGLDSEDILDASIRLKRFAPYLLKAFPETVPMKGIIESELVDIPEMQRSLEIEAGCVIPGRVILKKDSHLPISGSIKARGGNL